MVNNYLFYPQIDLQALDEFLNNSSAGYVFAGLSVVLLVVSVCILIHNLNDR